MGDEDKSRTAVERAGGADGDEEVGGVGFIDDVLDGGFDAAGLGGGEDDAVGVVLEEDADVGEVLFEGGAELGVVELVEVEGVRSGALLGVVEAVGGGHDQGAPGRQDAPRFREQAVPLEEVFDYLEGYDQVKGAVLEGKGSAVALEEFQVGKDIAIVGHGHGVRGEFQTNHAAGLSGQTGRAVTDAAAGIEHPLAPGETRGEGVSSQVLVEEIDVHLAGDHPLAGERGHSFLPRMA